MRCVFARHAVVATKTESISENSLQRQLEAGRGQDIAALAREFTCAIERIPHSTVDAYDIHIGIDHPVLRQPQRPYKCRLIVSSRLRVLCDAISMTSSGTTCTCVRPAFCATRS